MLDSVVYNEDCMVGMKNYPNKWFDLAEKLTIDLAVVTSIYVSLMHENIKRIADWKGWRIHGLCRPYYERICCLSIRTRTALRCAFRHWTQDHKGAGKNNLMPASCATKSSGIKGLCFLYKESRKEQQKTFRKWGCGFIRIGLFGYKKGWLHTSRQYANDGQFQSGQLEGIVLRRKRNYRSQENIRIKIKPDANTNCKGNGLTYCCSQSYGEGGLQAI